MKNIDRFSIIPLNETISAIHKFALDMRALPFPERCRVTKSARTELFGKNIRLGSVRLQTFAAYGTTCICCERKASHFAIERHIGNDQYHINLYGITENGSELLFTHDHILARSLGGADNIRNTQTMCTECNAFKSIEEQKILEQRKVFKEIDMSKMVA